MKKTIYVCRHWADPMAEIQFKSLEDAKKYVAAYKKVTKGKRMAIRQMECS